MAGRSKKSQEHGWLNIMKRISKFVKECPGDETATLLAHLRELNISRPNPNTFYKTRPLVKDFAENIFAKFKIDPEESFFYPCLSKGSYAVNTISPITYLMSCVRPETEAIVELGSGWSSNLFQIYVGLGRTRSRTIEYIGAEYTNSGRDCGRKIAEFDGAINYLDFHMDFRAPDISFLKKYTKHILVYTHHSVEQVDKIDHHLYQMLHDLEAAVTIVHFEPVGWQRNADLKKARLENNELVFAKIAKSYSTAINTEIEQMRNAAWWSWRLKYNYNLISITKRYTTSGQAKMVRTAYDFGGIGNVLNPTTLLHLDFVKN